MELSQEQIDFIRHDVRAKGITLDALADSLTDHICCAIEAEPGTDFRQTYDKALTAFGEGGLNKIQEETISLLILKKEHAMKKTMYVLGYFAAMLFTSGILFKLQHWPGAAIMLVLGTALLNFGFLPMFFYDRYKRAIG